MKQFWTLTSIALLLSSWSGPLAAQSLVEAAERAREARERQKGPAEQYTNEDLDAGQPEGEESDDGAASAPGNRPRLVPPRSTGNEAEWRARAEAARQAITANEQRVEAARQRVNDLRQDRTPTANVMSPTREQDRQAALDNAFDDMKQAEADVEESLRVLVDLQQEARVAGVPAGWLR